MTNMSDSDDPQFPGGVSDDELYRREFYAKYNQVCGCNMSDSDDPQLKDRKVKNDR